ncbi:hypothetical protein PAMA_002242 [Pampus argenteus]
MTDSENTTQPLLNPPRQTVINVGEQGVRSSRAYKVTAITVFACVLIAGQVMTVYFLLNQRTDIKALEEQNNNLNAQLKNGRSVDVPMRMHIPMNTLPKLMTDSVDEEAYSDAPEEMGGLSNMLTMSDADV